MKHLSIDANQVKSIFFPNQATMNSSYALMKKMKDRFKKEGYVTYNSRTLPREWFLSAVQKEVGYSNSEMDLVRKCLEEEAQAND